MFHPDFRLLQADDPSIFFVPCMAQIWRRPGELSGFCLHLLGYLLGCYGLVLVRNGLLMLRNGSQYHFRHFRKIPNADHMLNVESLSFIVETLLKL